MSRTILLREYCPKHSSYLIILGPIFLDVSLPRSRAVQDLTGLAHIESLVSTEGLIVLLINPAVLESMVQDQHSVI
jgi:hypothetical protein